MILAGIVVALIPTFQGNTTNDNDIVFNLMFLLSSFFASCSLVYKEKALKDEMEMDAVVFQLCTVFWTFVLGWVLAPMNSLHFLGKDMMTLTELPEYMRGGFMCLCGVNSINVGQIDDCKGSWIILLIFCTFAAMMMVAYASTIKLSGSNFLNMISTLSIPLIQIAFAIPYINVIADELHGESVLGLLIIVFGLLRYENGPHIPRELDECVLTLDQEFDSISADFLFHRVYQNLPGKSQGSSQQFDLIPFASLAFEIERFSKSKRQISLIGYGLSKFIRVTIVLNVSENLSCNRSCLSLQMHFNGLLFLKYFFLSENRIQIWFKKWVSTLLLYSNHLNASLA
jgi:hypothetical protein